MGRQDSVEFLGKYTKRQPDRPASIFACQRLEITRIASRRGRTFPQRRRGLHTDGAPAGPAEDLRIGDRSRQDMLKEVDHMLRPGAERTAAPDADIRENGRNRGTMQGVGQSRPDRLTEPERRLWRPFRQELTDLATRLRRADRRVNPGQIALRALVKCADEPQVGVFRNQAPDQCGGRPLGSGGTYMDPDCRPAVSVRPGALRFQVLRSRVGTVPDRCQENHAARSPEDKVTVLAYGPPRRIIPRFPRSATLRIPRPEGDAGAR